MTDKDNLSQSRRDFIRKSSLAAAGVSFSLSAIKASSYSRIVGANERVRMGFIGVGNRGTQLLTSFMTHADAEIAALCDVYEPYTLRDRSKVHPRYIADVGGQVPKMGEAFSRPPDRYNDFRRLLEKKDIDAVCIATPDHWHAAQTILALQAGKDIYCEKPLSITLQEGRRMINAAAATKQVVAVGLNRRASSVYQSLLGTLENKIGKVTVARAYRISNMYPEGIGKMKPEAPPKDFNWDMWLGPREYRPYQFNIAPYKFRWWKEYSSQMGNWGVHYLDVIRWMLREQAPVSVMATGGKYALDDDRTIPDTMEVTFEFASGAIAVFGIYEASGGNMFSDGEVEFRGGKGNLYVNESGYRVVPAMPGSFQTFKPIQPEAKKIAGGKVFGDLNTAEDTTDKLVRNFLDCVKSRATPYCTLEEGHRSTSFAHLANIALEMKTRLKWDAQKELFIDNPEANKLLNYEYRKEWKLV